MKIKIQVKCYGVRVSVNVEPKAIDFDRMLLYRKDRRRITFTNSNLIPLYMVLSGYNKLPPQFSFSAVKSWVQPLMSFSIEIEYEANEVRVINNEVIYVLVIHLKCVCCIFIVNSSKFTTYLDI